ncbi:uncharacterized protein LOC119895019 isoform X2 [Micropterus salmoides]|uniref:uncharacterized protein LOC119895019 isoform X2 n=1 Tax=Micropterus salmoides TaxID=27706 RepID=UPI0018EA7157|nr:uncharacterized protein LOC119895019 isoform X2 [Micropterus salmoides]
MEADNHDNTTAGGGGESKTKSLRPNVKDEMEDCAAKAKWDPVNEPDEAQHSEKNSESTRGESEIKSVPSATKEKVMAELTLVLIGDTNSIEIGSKNILLDHDEQANVEQFSSKLYDLCGRLIYVINMLGLQNIDKFPLYQEVHAFILLLPNGRHNSHYSSGVQWLEKAFGKRSLAYLMTVVTHESDEKCESALTDLKANSSEKRYHTCTRSMMDEREIIALLEKIDVMVSENDHHCYSGLICDENKEKIHLDHRSHKEEGINSSELQQNQTDELEERAAPSECDPVEDAKHSRTVGGESEIKSVSSATNEKGKADEVREVKNESSSNTGELPMDKCDAVRDTIPTSQTVSTVTKELDDLEERAATSKCDPVNEPGDVEYYEKSDDSRTVERESEIKSVSSATNEKGKADEVREVKNESSSNTGELPMDKCDAVRDTIPTSQTVSTVTKELDDLEERAATSKDLAPAWFVDHGVQKVDISV